MSMQGMPRPQCLVLSPSSALWDQQTLFLLHRRGDSARVFMDLWRPLVDEGWTLVVPQSSQPWDSASWCWDDLNRARQEVLAHFEECQTKRGLDPSRIIAAGIGQGARLATEIACEAGLPWLSVMPELPLPSVPLHTRGVVVLGEGEKEIASIPGVEVRRMPGSSDMLPGDFAARASEMLRLIDLG